MKKRELVLPKPNPKISKQLLTYDKPTCAKLFRWISGHSFHRYHNFLTTPILFSDPTCRICGQGNEETNHLFAYCEGLTQIRMKICGLTILPEPFKWTPNILHTRDDQRNRENMSRGRPIKH
jgi:hypothetical protein